MTTVDDVAVLKWIDDESSPYQVSPIEFLNEIEPLQYHLGEPKTYNITKKFTYGKYSVHHDFMNLKLIHMYLLKF